MTTFTITGTDLHDTTSWASRVIPARPVQPLLGGLLLDVGEDTLTVSAFDYETAVSVTTGALVQQPGRALLAGRLLADIAKAVNRDVQVTVTVDTATATVRCGRSEWTLPTLPVEDYPALPGLSDPVGEVDAEELRHALGRVLPCAHTGGESATQALTGVKVDSVEDVLTLSATDRYRVGQVEVAWKPGADIGPIDALVPVDLLEAAARAPGSGTVALYAGESTFGLATGTHRVVGRQVAARYPDLARVMPKPGRHYVVVDVPDLARAIDEAMVMLEKDSATVRLVIGPDEVEVSTTGDDRRATASARVHTLTGTPVTLGVNAGYLRTCLRLLETEAAVLHLGDRTVLALPAAASGEVVEGYRHVVMRVRLP